MTDKPFTYLDATQIPDCEGLPDGQHNIPVVSIMQMLDGTMVRLQEVVPSDATSEQIRACELQQHAKLQFMRELVIFKPQS